MNLKLNLVCSDRGDVELYLKNTNLLQLQPSTRAERSYSHENQADDTIIDFSFQDPYSE